MMTKEQLRNDFIRLMKLDSFEDCKELCKIFLEHLWNVGISQGKKVFSSVIERDAAVINQIIFSKTLAISKLLEGVGYQDAKLKLNLKPFIDPYNIALLTRNLFETVVVFYLIYIDSKNYDEKLIRYNLWVSSGLKYRQRFETFAKSSENIKKLTDEQKEIALLAEEIYDTPLFKSIDTRSQLLIDNLLKDKKFLIGYENFSIRKLSWKEAGNLLKFKENLFNEIYTYLSLYAHPTQVHVFQFREIFSSKDMVNITTLNVRYFFFLLSVFIADYIKLFPDVKKNFEILDSYKQITINGYNMLMRDESCSINDSGRLLD